VCGLAIVGRGLHLEGNAVVSCYWHVVITSKLAAIRRLTNCMQEGHPLERGTVHTLHRLQQLTLKH